MSNLFLIPFISLSLFAQVLFADQKSHDFSRESWSAGKSCLICHDLKNGLPKLAPTGSRVVDLAKLSPVEQAAYEINPHNAICLVCHQALHSAVAQKKQNSDNNTSFPTPNGPSSTAQGTQGSTTVRVINTGTNMMSCLSCHDLHNKDSLKLLKQDLQN